MVNMKLYFNGEAKDVGIKTLITRRLLTKLEEPFAALRASGTNTAMEDAIKTNPKAVQYLGGTWVEDLRKEHEEAYQGAPPEKIDGMVQKALAAKLLEEFPGVYEAMANPTTEIHWENAAAVDACFAVAREIIDEKGLTTEELEAIGDDDFWEEQDLEEVTQAVATFRERVQRRAAGSGGHR